MILFTVYAKIRFPGCYIPGIFCLTWCLFNSSNLVFGQSTATRYINVWRCVSWDAKEGVLLRVHVFFLLVFTIHLLLHRFENRTRPISTPYDGRHWWDSNLRTPAFESPTLPLCYRLQNVCVCV